MTTVAAAIAKITKRPTIFPKICNAKTLKPKKSLKPKIETAFYHDDNHLICREGTVGLAQKAANCAALSIYLCSKDVGENYEF